MLGRGTLERLAPSLVEDEDQSRRTDKRTLNGEALEKEKWDPANASTSHSPERPRCEQSNCPTPGLSVPTPELRAARPPRARCQNLCCCPEQSCVPPRSPGLPEPCQLTFLREGQVASPSNSPDPRPSLTFAGWQVPAHSERSHRHMQKRCLSFWLQAVPTGSARGQRTHLSCPPFLPVFEFCLLSQGYPADPRPAPAPALAAWPQPHRAKPQRLFLGGPLLLPLAL